MNGLIKSELDVNGIKVNVVTIDNSEYISLTDLAKYSNSENTANVIIHWMSNKETFNYIGLWEKLNNDNFNFTEFREIKNNELYQSSFTLSPKRWNKRTNAIGIIPSAGRYSKGTYAHPDIAFEFASWLSPEFKLYLIKEFQRLKKNEAYQEKIEWHANRVLTKMNYLVHTDAVKNYIVPTLTEKQIRYVYQEEADLLNVALFGMTAKEWRDKNKELSKTGNIRDYTDLIHLIILSNLENINAELIEENLSQSERLIKLNNIARKQMVLFKNNKTLENLNKEIKNITK